MVEHCSYPVYGINVISLNFLINKVVESQVSRFCWDHNMEIRSNSRDVNKVMLHFIVNAIIETCGRFQTTVNVLNYTALNMEILDESMQPAMTKCVNKLLKTLKICVVNMDVPINELQQHHIDDIRIAQQNCCVNSKSLMKLKKFFTKHDLTFLRKDINNNIATQHILAK